MYLKNDIKDDVDSSLLKYRLSLFDYSTEYYFSRNNSSEEEKYKNQLCSIPPICHRYFPSRGTRRSDRICAGLSGY